ncbi:hypothetical protein CLMAG_62060 [Clostridium magnum DSM 2767]|uniref:Uncharacterized protein n=1 Tax=Clostridium magnum DSM 2767 TaxID=1121326 RepID=A0A162QI14_9CLOT|nr:ferritin-like domain-containing protein [Clostridium magnum]KZL88551.1 hypothetical protein CLMAG_62060 [Clostridium magnum DSM 2767]SHI14416.1 hypothetical protein SAMN02745944_02723 [Clostridium magnum DSM 2767]
MYYSIPNFVPQNYFRIHEMKKSYKTLEEALALIKEAIQGEREDELFYDYLLSLAPTKEEKDIIASIRDDEKFTAPGIPSIDIIKMVQFLPKTFLFKP